jgi:hypothetical protein
VIRTPNDVLHVFVLEFCPTDVEKLAVTEHGLKDAMAIKLVVHMLNAMHFLYQNSILHRFVR